MDEIIEFMHTKYVIDLLLNTRREKTSRNPDDRKSTAMAETGSNTG